MAPKKPKAPRTPAKPPAVQPLKASDKPHVYRLDQGESLPGPYPTKK